MIHSRRWFLRSSALLPIALTLPTALAATPAEEYVHSLGNQILQLAKGGRRGDKALQRRFANLLDSYVNLNQLMGFALGTYRAGLSAGDRSTLHDLVANYTAALFVYYVSEFQGSELKVLNSAPQGSFTTVDSAIDGNGEPFKWRLSGSGGSYRVADINVRGIWLSIAMNDLFQKTLRASNGKFDVLFEKLREANTW